ncbi:PREDICTED: zinc finger protein 678-like [Papilio xuthus]|uniref:Zinc finger protein 678-like n=1 Tax=Papilio xuthus TaxID=66420 RepID=A0AAJ6Z2E4_PAPXU|nr:PREDICTED: zinc finger protein 678-like [Papilio xuthus]XP_013163834.1 PREDICTED: zinc finger protein 678-like [Papilio xuthus]
MTVAERKNAASLLHLTTARPFTHMGSTLKCFYCKKYYSDLSDLLEHTLTHPVEAKDTILKKYIMNGKRMVLVDISILKCRLCWKRYTDINSIRQHLVIEHDKKFSIGANGLTEYNLSIENGNLTCHICKNTFHEFVHLKSHMYTHTGRVVCEACGVNFINRYHLSLHMDTHIKKKLTCKSCDKEFSKYGQLKYHRAIIHKTKNKRKKTCEYCTDSFKEHHTKMLHLKIVHGIVKSFPCLVCNTNFDTRRALTEHTTKYHTEKYKCETCSKCFEIASKLRYHMRVHTNSKEFICAYCNNGYMLKASLIKHMKRLHSFYYSVPKIM